jgi:hypothetical protein
VQEPYPVRFSAGLQHLRDDATALAQAQGKVSARDEDAADQAPSEPKRKR